ncbi:MAG TPA: succinylglutamate desuccinylase/aspartoacylase family protein [bacterium]|nr:succinylglutamate desuccinylase/aspartoacylase family protein [bacterium]
MLGRAGSATNGPTLVCIAGIHGNEPAGLEALATVFDDLRAKGAVPNGELIGLAGNLRALAEGVRYISKDLNRQWKPERVDALLREGNETPDEEDLEQRELLAVLHEIFARARGPVYVFDLHTASSATAPFLIFGDTLRNRDFAMSFPAPIVLGLEEQVRGTIMEYVSSLGHVAIALEGGQHDDPASVKHHQSAIWIALSATGVFDAGQATEDARAALHNAAKEAPRIVEIVSRHAIQPEDRFEMKRGFRNFAKVERGEVLANDKSGPILSPGAYHLLFPLYQKLGDDGFFLARPVNSVWLAVSWALRRSGISRLAPYLPGVSRHPRRRDTLVVDQRIARFWIREVFHLLGYRLGAMRGQKVIVRKQDPNGNL